MCSTMVGGGWRLAVGGGWWLAVGNWRLVAVGGGWRRLVVGDWWLVAVGSGWQLAVGRRWQLAAVGGSWWLAVGGGWRLMGVGGWRLAVPQGGPSQKKKSWSLKDRPGKSSGLSSGQNLVFLVGAYKLLRTCCMRLFCFATKLVLSHLHPLCTPTLCSMHTKGFCGASGEATAHRVNLYVDMVAAC